ncbi:MAG TPA: hypothetical protein VGN06_04295 [Gaiellaceae bacterium]
MELNKGKAAPLAAAALVAGLLCGVAVAGNPHGTPPGQATTASDTSAGVKPSNTTSKDQTCTTGGGQGSSATCQSGTSSKSDSSKRYGNGRTAAQIANGKGAPAGTPIYGPGNSQPHKICGRDVHAYKGASDKKCPSGTSSTASGSTALMASSTATRGTVGTTAGSRAGTSRSSSTPSATSGVLGSSHALSKPVTSGAKPANAARAAATFTG